MLNYSNKWRKDLNTKKPSIVIIEDHPVMRNGLTVYFASMEDWTVSGTASSLEEARKLFSAPQFEADIVLLDIQLPDGWGFDIIPFYDAQNLPTQNRPLFAVYSSFDDYAHVSAALSYGVRAYISKQRSESEILAILREVLNGKTWIDELVKSKFENTTNVIELLTKREAEIFTLIKSGISNRQIADQLKIKNRTVENHISSIHDKTGLSRLDLLKL
jgi:two-component system response regulator NreC